MVINRSLFSPILPSLSLSSLYFLSKNFVKLLSDFSRIPESKFSAMGYGEHRPVLPVSSIGKNSVDIRKARAKNRRVEIYMDAFIKQNTLTN